MYLPGTLYATLALRSLDQHSTHFRSRNVGPTFSGNQIWSNISSGLQLESRPTLYRIEPGQYLAPICYNGGGQQDFEDSSTSSKIPNIAEMPNEIRDLAITDDKSYPYVYSQNVTIPLKSSTGIVRCNVYRPKTTEKVPVLITYGPYGKDISYAE